MITVYTTPTCAYCVQVKKLLDKKGFVYDIVDLEDNPDIRKKLFEKTGAMTVPITEIGDELIVGWNPAKLVTTLNAI